MVDEDEQPVDEEGEPVEEEIDYDKEEEAARRRRASRLKILAVLVALAVGGFSVWYLFLSNSAPEARFTHSSVDLRLSVNAVGSTDRDANIASYSWDFGDGTTGTGQTAVHGYTTVDDYIVTLTVTDARGATGVASETVQIRASPLASFVARHETMTVLFDASYSRPSSITNSPISTYAWDFGDGTTGSGVATSHSYIQAGRYRVALTVADGAGAVANATRFVSPAATTVDILLDEFFTAGCPYEEYWALRFYSYGDEILKNQAPCTDYYPWVLFTANAPQNPSYVYTLYRWNARVRNHPGYSLTQPVMFPVLNPTAPVAPNSEVRFNLTFEYLNSVLLDFYANTTDFPVNSGFSDGFGYLVQGTIEADLATAKRLFGMKGETGGRPIALSLSGSASRWDGSSWTALPSLPAAPVGPGGSSGWTDLVVSSELTAYAIATDSTVYRLINNAGEWTPFINPPAPLWAKPATDIVGLVVDHDTTAYAMTRGLPSPVKNIQAYRFSGTAPGEWTLVANLSAQHTTSSGGIADLALAGGTGNAASLYALPVNARLPRDPVVYLPTKTIGTEAWTNPLAGVVRSDDKYANASADGKTQRYANYRIAPTGTETGIRTVEIGIEGKTTATGDDDVLVQYSVDNGGNWTTAGTFDPSSTDTTVFFNITGDRAWSFGNLSNAKFTTRIVYKRVDTTASVVSVDWLPVRVAVVANATFIRSFTGGSSWSSVGAPSPADTLAKNRAVAIHSPYDVHALLDNGSLLRTARGAASWSWIAPPPGASAVATWEDAAWDGQGGLLVAVKEAGGPEVWRYDLLARTWTNVTVSLALPDVVAISTGDMQQWWFAQTDPGSEAGPLESRYAQWLEENGNFNYDIFNGFEWYYQPDITDLNATVAADGTVTIRVFWTGWGFDVLQARWFYWGAADYSDAVNRPYGEVQPQGWSPMETCWCERAKIQGAIGSSLDLNFTAIQGYSFSAWANWGPDGIPKTDDDLPSWVFPPFLMDYVPRVGPAAAGYPNSELAWYEGRTSIHGTPGSYAYGEPYEYLNAPTRWRLDAGYTLTMLMPTGSVPWYDPVRSTWDPVNIKGIYQDFSAPMTLRLIRPGGDFAIWDPRAKVLSLAGPHNWGVTSLPLEPTPWIEFAPEISA